VRRLNGPQTTGRDYRNLSEPQYHTRRDNNVAIGMRDGTALMADVHRPETEGPVPAADRRVALPASNPGPRGSHGVR
jgi:predicted acyl esterase